MHSAHQRNHKLAAAATMSGGPWEQSAHVGRLEGGPFDSSGIGLDDAMPVLQRVVEETSKDREAVGLMMELRESAPTSPPSRALSLATGQSAVHVAAS